MTYLKKDTLNPDGENILLFELSAYSRMQYIEFMVEEESHYHQRKAHLKKTLNWPPC
jgi:hypothetical protein